jgi:polyphosphate kinase
MPLLERVKLCSIVSSNLDEFVGVRIARLEQMVSSGKELPFPDGSTPAETLVAARKAIIALQAAQDDLWLEQLRPALAAERIRVVSTSDCGALELRSLARRFRREIRPLLTPVALEATARSIPSLGLNVAVSVRGKNGESGRVLRVLLPEGMPRFLEVGSDDVLLPLEDVILEFLPLVVDVPIEADAVFRITRDANLPVTGGTGDLVEAIEVGLRRRRVGRVVRLETTVAAAPALVDVLKRTLGLEKGQSYESRAPLALRGVLELAEADRPDLRSKPWHAATHRAFGGGGSRTALAEIARGDVLVHHPYSSYDSSVLPFVSAARDPRVETLKATVYRTGDASTTLASLVQAAQNSKEAVAVVEVKARFDERRNIDSGRSLERSGVDVVYGMPDLKVHAKLTLLVLRERGDFRRYVHIGTGNYHASNACSYEDLSLFTADDDIAADVATVFDAITGRTKSPVFRKLLVGPWYLRGGLLREIDRVARAASEARAARIRLKVNSLVDPEIIDRLYGASRAGATIEIITRGMCALRPGVSGMSERITVRSVLGRFLEHSRALWFQTDDRTTAWIGSPDLMPRNLDHRIEVLAPIEDEQLQAELGEVFDALLADTSSSWDLDRDGVWRRRQPRDGSPVVSAQRTLMTCASAAHDPT